MITNNLVLLGVFSIFSAWPISFRIINGGFCQRYWLRKLLATSWLLAVMENNPKWTGSSTTIISAIPIPKCIYEIAGDKEVKKALKTRSRTLRYELCPGHR